MATTKKGRMTAVERDHKQSQAKQLFISGFAIANISDIIGVGANTIAKWRDDKNWEDEKELQSLKPSTIRNLTLKCALAIQNGEPLPYKADDISKIVAAFDRITDNRKKAVYTMESLDEFSSYVLQKAGKQVGKKREQLLEQLQDIRPLFDDYISELLQNE